ncbi:hypothetical protein MPER_06984 [Moniliophthora perniciosa FA553]|nr:hypothetical protein MPER_06984 [Moniliophthora perniciosa FA553]
MTVDLSQFKTSMLNAQKFLPEKASLGQVVDNFCREAYNSLANLTDDDMAKISKDRSIVEVTRGAILDVNKSPLSSVITDSVRKKAMANLSYIEQLADGTRKVPAATPAEQNRAENNPVTKDDNDTLPSDQEQKSEEEVTIRTCSRAKTKMPMFGLRNAPRLASTISTQYTGAAEEASILCTAAELQQELQLLPFDSLDNKSTTTLVSLYNAATAALTSHLFSTHKVHKGLSRDIVSAG